MPANSMYAPTDTGDNLDEEDGGAHREPRKLSVVTQRLSRLHSSSVYERARFVRSAMRDSNAGAAAAVSDGVLSAEEEKAMFRGHSEFIDRIRPGGNWRMVLAVALCWLAAWSDSPLGAAWAWACIKTTVCLGVMPVGRATVGAGVALLGGRWRRLLGSLAGWLQSMAGESATAGGEHVSMAATM